MSRIRRFLENISSGRKKLAQETAEKSDKQYKYLHAESEGLDSERYREYFRELREREEFERLITASSKYPFRVKNMKLQRNGGSPIEGLFLNYWPIVLFFVLETVLLLWFTLSSSTGAWVPISGIVCAAILLWLLKWAGVKKELGLKFFCPFTIGLLCSWLVTLEEEEEE